MLTTGSTITRDVVAFEASARVSTAGSRSLKLRQNIEWIECETIRQALAVSTEKRQAARLMGITPRVLAHYLTKYPFLEGNKTHGRPEFEAFDGDTSVSTPDFRM